MRKKLTIEEMQEIAKKRGGECLSDTYVNYYFKLRWKCNKGHKWLTSPDSVKQGSWCPTCAGKAPLTIKQMHIIAKKRNGKCLSEKYKNADTKLSWKCKNGHEWQASPSSIKRGRWCPKCANISPIIIEDMREIAKERGGKCLSDIYINNQTKLRWKCKNGHEWEATPNCIKSKYWCPECRKLTIKEMREIATSRNGECLSEKCIGAFINLRWKCEKKHEWEATPHNIKNGTWCPICKESHGEKAIRKILNLNNILFIPQKTFPDCRGIRHMLPFDFFLLEYNILIEYDGIQHFEPIFFNKYSKEKAEKLFNNLKNNDRIKDDYCKSKGIKLLRIPYTEKNIENVLKKSLAFLK